MCLCFQAEGEKAELAERRREAEAERAAAREETARAQQEVMDLLSEKQTLESSHTHWQDLCQRLEAELELLQEDKAEALEQLSQVRASSSPLLPPGRTVLLLVMPVCRIPELVVTLECIGGTGHICHVFFSQMGCEEQPEPHSVFYEHHGI